MVENKPSDGGKRDNADVLRAGHIIPPYDKESNQQRKLRKAKANQLAKEDELSARQVPAEPANSKQAKREIPSFDLGEEIMAEHRRVIAVRRKAPSEKNDVAHHKAKVESMGHFIGQPRPVLSGPEQIIVEIVARDIESLRGRSASGA